MKLQLPTTHLLDELHDKVTILIPTYNRYRYLHRLLEYFLSYKPAPRIIILDSSSESIGEDFPEEFQNRQQICWRTFSSDTFFMHKLHDGLQEVKTPYSVFCPEDDFLALNGLLKGVQFLESNPDYSCVMGRCISHELRLSDSSEVFVWSPLFSKAQPAENEESLQRMLRYAEGKAIMNFYGLYRTKIHQRIWENTCEYVSDWGLIEYVPCILSYLYGKVAVLNVLFWSHERHMSGWASAERTREMYSQDKLGRAVNGLAANIVAQVSLSEREAQEVANDLLEKLADGDIPKQQKRSSARNKMTKKSNLVKKVWGTLNYLYYKALINNPLSGAKTDFTKIRSAVTGHQISHKLLEETRSDYYS